MTPILPDLDVWLRAFGRAQAEPQVVHAFGLLVRARRVFCIAPIRQGLLARCRDAAQFARLNSLLDGWGDLRLGGEDHTAAAALMLRQREAGRPLPAWHALLWACADRRGLAIWSGDRRWAAFTAAGCPWVAEPG
jgi:hypothetical protein